MTALLLVLVPIVSLWAILTTLVVLGDGLERRRHREADEVAMWRAKVDAMRRMHDEDGAA